MRAPHPVVSSKARHGVLTAIAGFILGLLVSNAGRGSRQEGRKLLEKGGRLQISALWHHGAGASVPAPDPPQPTGHKFGVVPKAPSLEAFESFQANPGLLDTDASLVAEFEAAPWLLPPRTEALPYAGVHDFDSLMELRSQPAGNYSKSVALLLFNKGWAVMAQNSIYSMVKFGGVRNYIAIAWTEGDLEACADLNLPCADVRSMLVEPLTSTNKPSRHDFLVMAWIKPAVVLRALELGYAVMVADTDIAYAVKPLWDSYLAFIHQGNADGAWQAEKPLNTGQFVLLPTRASLAFARKWAASAPDMLAEKVSDQKALPEFEGKQFVNCSSLCQCFRANYNLTQQGRRDKVAVFHTYFPSHYAVTQHWCTIGSPGWMPRIDPCPWSVLYLHPICTTGFDSKAGVLRAAGFWFVDDEGEGCQPQEGAASQVPACRPLQWRLPQTEVAHYSCHSFDLGLVTGGEPAAAKALRAGASGDEALQWLEASAESKC